MTRDEVAALLQNQATARARAFLPVSEPVCLVDREALEDAVRRGRRGQQLTLVKPDALPPPVELVLPLPPSWNRAFRVVAMPTKARHVKGAFRGERVWTARVYKSKEAEEYAATVGAHVRRQLEEPFPRHVMLRVSGDVVMARAGCDLDDRFKVLLDSLQGYVFQNDEQVAEFGRVRRLVDSTHPHVRLTFEPIAVDRYGKATS